MRLRWRRRPVLAFAVRAFVVLAPLTAAVVVGIVASRQFRPRDVPEIVLWALWTAAASLLALWLVDVVVRRLLPLHRLLQLCLAFPDRAPSRLRIAVRAAVPRRPEAMLARTDPSASATAVAEQVVTLLAALTLHDRRTRGHSERVCAFTNLLATEMRLSDDDRDRLTWVALVHDIGKLHVPARLLNKPGKPTVSEWHLLKTHPERGAALTAPLRDWLGPWVDAVLEHHERYDGRGYPHGLTGEQISVAARVIAVTDAFEVMTAPRAYRRPVDAQTARAELARHAGSQFDPEVVRHFLAVGLPELRRAMGPFAWLAEIPFVSSWPRLEAAASTTATHAMTATAAASTAGLLALGGGGGTAASATTPSFSGEALAPVVELPSAPSASEQATAAAGSTSGSQQSAHVHQAAAAVRHRHARAARENRPDMTPAVAAERIAPAQTHRTSSDQPDAYPSSPSDADHSQATCNGGCDADHYAGEEPDSTPAAEHHGHAYGHDHAPGWQKNWGPGGRYPGHHHH